MSTLTCDHVSAACQQVDTPATRDIKQNADLLNLVTGILNDTLSIVEQPMLSLAIGSADKIAAIGDFTGNSLGNRNVRAAAVSSELIVQTLSLLKLGTESPMSIVVMTVGATFAKKLSLTLGLVEDDKRTKVIAACADLASALLTVFIAAEMAAPVGTVLLAGSIVQAIASAYSLYATTNSP